MVRLHPGLFIEQTALIAAEHKAIVIAKEITKFQMPRYANSVERLGSGTAANSRGRK